MNAIRNDDRIDQPRTHIKAVCDLLRQQIEQEREHFQWEEAMADANSDAKREFRDLRRDAELRLKALDL